MARVKNAAAKTAPASKAKAAAPVTTSPAKDETVKSTEAKNTPVIITKQLDTRELPNADEGTVTFQNNGVKVEETTEIEVENNLDRLDEKTAKLRFLEEKITIIIADSNEKEPETHVFCQVNGKGPGPGGTPWLPRNQEITVARKFVEVLAGARPVRLKTVERIAENGERVMDHKRTSSQRYPFTVVNDPNPHGRIWLQNLLGRRAG